MAYLNANIPATYAQIRKELLYDGKKHHGIKHKKEVDDMNPSFQKNLRTNTFHNNRANNRKDGVFGSKSSETIYSSSKDRLCKMHFKIKMESNRWYIRGGVGCSVHNDHSKTKVGDIRKRSNQMCESICQLVKDGEESNICDSSISNL